MLGSIYLLSVGIASANPPSSPDLRLIIVTGRGLERDKTDTGSAVLVIDRRQIERSASGRVEEVLRDVAGVQGFRRSDSRSAHPTSQSVTLRGLGGNASSRALLVLDGVPQSDPFGGWSSFPAYSTDRIGQIRITRGGGSGSWGPGAMAGTIEMESVAPGEAEPVEASLAIGTRHSVDARASILQGSDREFVSLAGAMARGNGFIPIVAEDRGPADRPAAYRQGSAALRLVHALSATVEAQGNFSTFEDHRNRGTANSDNRASGANASLRLVGKGRLGWSILAYGQRRRFASQFVSVDADRQAATLVLDQYRVPASGWGARAEFRPLTGPLDVRIGGDLRRVEGETRELYSFLAGEPTRRRAAGGRSLTGGLFGELTCEQGRLALNASARWDRWSISGGHLREKTLAGQILTDVDFPDRDGWQGSGRISLAYEASPSIRLRAAAYRGWRLPTINELFRPFRVGADATAANAALEPETLYGAEAGLDWELGRGVRASLTLYRARLSDAIANVTIAQGPGVFPGVSFVSASGSYRRRENLDAIHSHGVETDVIVKRGGFDGRLSYAYARARVDDNGIGHALDGLRPAQVPAHQLSATLGWSGTTAQRLSLTARALSGQFEDDGNDRRLRGALTFDATGSFPLAKRLEIGARAENIFDRRIEAGINGDGDVERATPRTVWIDLRLR